MTGAAAQQVVARCRELARCTEIPGETTRLFLCDPMRDVHAKLRTWMQGAGLEVRVDAIGNLRGLLPGADPKAGRLLIGSHLDTVPNAGAFDGVLGVMMGLAAAELLSAGESLPFAIEVIGFSEEEGVRFGQPFLGSRALVGRADRDLLSLLDSDGLTVSDSIRSFGLDPAGMAEAEIAGDTIGYLEVHIEQGPVLEVSAQPIGVVRAIAGQTRANLRFLGHANHAGTTPMNLRHDAMAAAAEWIVGVERVAQHTEGLVATVGQVETLPGAGNVIAGEVLATVDVRHASDQVRLRAVDQISELATEAGRKRGVAVETKIRMQQPGVPMSERLQRLLERAAAGVGCEAPTLVSGAGHDAMVLAARVPAAMLFVRSPGGLSHHPDETVLVEDVDAALQTVMEFLRLLGDDGAGKQTSDA